MVYVILGGLVIIALLLVALVIAVKTVQAKNRKVTELEVALESDRTEIRRQGAYQKQREEAQHNADAKKETLHTGDDAADFGNSLDVLHNAGKNSGH